MADRPSCAFSCVPLPGDLGNSHQGFGVQFTGLSLETQSRRCRGAKRERDRKCRKLARAGAGLAGLEGPVPTIRVVWRNPALRKAQFRRPRNHQVGSSVGPEVKG